MGTVNGLMDAQALGQWILRKLGAPLVRVELVQDDLDDAIEQARRWFSAKKGFSASLAMNLITNQGTYDLPDIVDTVLDITFALPGNDISALVDPLALMDGLIPANTLGIGGVGTGTLAASGGFLSNYVEVLTWLKQARLVLGSEIDWEQRERTLYVFPPAIKPGAMIVHYKASYFTIEQLNERDHDLVKRYALACAREKMATVRSKFDSFPGAQGAATVDGVAQLQRAIQDQTDLTEELAQSAFPLGFLRG